MRAHKAAEYAQEIVTKYEGKTDLEKLQGYANEIALLNTYNTTAASTRPYGDPWQLIYVFDGDSNTNVVCEGYAKAFKYLCDLSTFDKEIYCFTVSGGFHMWNVVQINGQNYYVDITLADQPDGFDYDYFLAGGTSSNDGKNFNITKTSGGVLSTAYYESEKNIHCDGYLVLANSYYHEHSYISEWVNDETHHWCECSCGEKTDVFQHSFHKNIDAAYLQSEATCTESAQYYSSCECGKTGTDFFSYGEPNGHSYDANGVCATCGDVIVVDKPTETPDVDDNSGNASVDDDTSDNTIETPDNNQGTSDNDNSQDNENEEDNISDTDVDSHPDDSDDTPSDNIGNNDKKGGLLNRFIKLLAEFLIEIIKFLFT